MASAFESVYASVIIDYTEHDHLTRAHFSWNESNPTETYTIDVNSGLSVGLDSHLPVRPDSINLYDKSVKRLKALSDLVGPELAAAMADTRTLGSHVLSIELPLENRLAIARLQFHSPSTPPRVRDGVALLLDSHDNNPRLASHRYMVERANNTDQISA